MTSYIVTITDKRGHKLAEFESVGSHGAAMRAGNARTEWLPTARFVKAVRA